MLIRSKWRGWTSGALRSRAPAPLSKEAALVQHLKGSSVEEGCDRTDRPGLRADRAFDGRSMKSQLKSADRSGARWAHPEHRLLEFRRRALLRDHRRAAGGRPFPHAGGRRQCYSGRGDQPDHGKALLAKRGRYRPAGSSTQSEGPASVPTGSTWKPSSRSALAELANIIFLPMRTASTVARGSFPRSLPVTDSSKNANAMATACGSLSKSPCTARLAVSTSCDSTIALACLLAGPRAG